MHDLEALASIVCNKFIFRGRATSCGGYRLSAKGGQFNMFLSIQVTFSFERAKVYCQTGWWPWPDSPLYPPHW